MRCRIALLLVSLLLFGAGTAQAGATCPLIEDRPGDAGSVSEIAASFLPNDPALDVLSADFTSTSSTLAGTMRLQKLDRTVDRYFEWRFSARGVDFYVSAYLPRSGSLEAQNFLVGYLSEKDGDASGYAFLASVAGQADVPRSELSFTVDTRVLAKQARLRVGDRLTKVEALSYRALAASQVTVPADFTEQASFVFGKGSCLRPSRGR